jgi:GNAT superfamily N-acetyltransferase
MEELRIDELPLGHPGLKDFVELPWRLYRNDPCWTPPLRGDLLGSRMLGLKGLLTPGHPYHREAEVTHFLAWRNGITVGRVTAAINRRYNGHYGARIGSFGFFEVIEDYGVARALLDRAKDWVAERGMDILRGPGEYSNVTHERQGILIDGFEYPPTVELTHNPPYYADFMDRYGFRTAMDYHAYVMDITTPIDPALARLAERARKRHGITTRQVDLKDLKNEVRLIVKLYNEAWAENWGFLALSDEEADALADTLKPVIDEGLMRFAYVDGEPAAVLGALPDPNRALRPRWKWYGDPDIARVLRLLRMRRHIPFVRLMFFGIPPRFRRMGLDGLLFAEVKEYCQKNGYTECEASMLLDDNYRIIGSSEFMGGRRYKTWRIYEMALK